MFIERGCRAGLFWKPRHLALMNSAKCLTAYGKVTLDHLYHPHRFVRSVRAFCSSVLFVRSLFDLATSRVFCSEAWFHCG